MKAGLSYRRLSPICEPLKKALANSTIFTSPVKGRLDPNNKCTGKRSSPFTSSKVKNSQKKNRVCGSKICIKLMESQQYFSTKDHSQSNLKSHQTKPDESVFNYSNFSLEKKEQRSGKKGGKGELEEIYNKSKEILFKMSRKLGAAEVKIKQLET